LLFAVLISESAIPSIEELVLEELLGTNVVITRRAALALQLSLAVKPNTVEADAHTTT
jgi:hypothetical protein